MSSKKMSRWVSALVLPLALLAGGVAHAQIYMGRYNLDDGHNQVGHVIVASSKNPGAPYVEHWFLPNGAERISNGLSSVEIRTDARFAANMALGLNKTTILAATRYVRKQAREASVAESDLSLSLGSAAEDDTRVRIVWQCHAQGTGTNATCATEQKPVGALMEEQDGTGWVEHWVLLPEYVYPSSSNNLITSLRSANGELQAVLSEARRRSTLSTYIHVDVDEPQEVTDEILEGISKEVKESGPPLSCALGTGGRSGSDSVPYALALLGLVALCARRRTSTMGRVDR